MWVECRKEPLQVMRDNEIWIWLTCRVALPRPLLVLWCPGMSLLLFPTNVFVLWWIKRGWNLLCEKWHFSRSNHDGHLSLSMAPCPICVLLVGSWLWLHVYVCPVRSICVLAAIWWTEEEVEWEALKSSRILFRTTHELLWIHMKYWWPLWDFGLLILLLPTFCS